MCWFVALLRRKRFWVSREYVGEHLLEEVEVLLRDVVAEILDCIARCRHGVPSRPVRHLGHCVEGQEAQVVHQLF